jgi:hypothetical protein
MLTQRKGGRVAGELVVTSRAGRSREYIDVARIGDKREAIPMTKRQVIELEWEPRRSVAQARIEGDKRLRQRSEVGIIARVTDVEVGCEHW